MGVRPGDRVSAHGRTGTVVRLYTRFRDEQADVRWDGRLYVEMYSVASLTRVEGDDV